MTNLDGSKTNYFFQNEKFTMTFITQADDIAPVLANIPHSDKMKKFLVE